MGTCLDIYKKYLLRELVPMNLETVKADYLFLSHVQIILNDYSGVVLWNSLLSGLRSAQSLASFKRGLEG